MRIVTFLAVAVAAWLHAAALAQSARGTARETPPPATAAAAELQAYALLLQDAEARLARAREAHASGRTESQAGAFSQERIDLMQTIRSAWQDMQKVPPRFSETVAYQAAQRRMQQEFGRIGPDRELSKEKADQAAQDALMVLSDLRREVVSAAGQAGGTMPPSAVHGGGANR